MDNTSATVAHCTRTFLGRTESWIEHQIRYQNRYPSIVLTNIRENKDLFDFDKVYSIKDLNFLRRYAEKLIRRFWLGYYPYHYQNAQEHNVQLLHAHSGTQGVAALALAKALGVPLITSFYGADMFRHVEGVNALRERYLQLFVDGMLFFVEGPFAQNRLVSLGCPIEKIAIVHIGADLSKLKYVPRKISETDSVFVLMASTFTEKKGMEYGVEAFCQAAHQDDRLQLTVVGDARPGQKQEAQIRRRLFSLVQQYNMQNRVTFLGYVSLHTLWELAYSHHIFLHPSVTASSGDSEGGSPVVITEMAASGMPVVATYHCDIPQVVIHGQTGILVEERNIQQICSALLQLTSDIALRHQLGFNAREHIDRNYSLQQQGEALGKHYQAVLSAV